MTTPTDRPWPPLIIAADVPRWVRWRDVVLTLLMWGLFVVLLEGEIRLVFGPHLERLGIGSFHTEADWIEFLERLLPFLATALGLVALLFIAGMFTWRRQTRAFALAEPPPLPLADQAGRAGVDEATLTAARAERIAVVHVGPNGGLKLEIRAPRAGAVSTTAAG
jgi:poly-beta-1,6-N-acetyl-D-glucosamine biosynthesis protein PgaD